MADSFAGRHPGSDLGELTTQFGRSTFVPDASFNDAIVPIRSFNHSSLAPVVERVAALTTGAGGTLSNPFPFAGLPDPTGIVTDAAGNILVKSAFGGAGEDGIFRSFGAGHYEICAGWNPSCTGSNRWLN